MAEARPAAGGNGICLERVLRAALHFGYVTANISRPEKPAPHPLPRRRTYRKRWLPELLFLLVGMAATAAAFSFTDWDIRITDWFYTPDRPNPFGFSEGWFWGILYHTVGYPVMALAVAATVLLVRSARSAFWRARRVHLAFVLLTLALGPGLAVNVGLKDYWGRPRPRHIQQFGGNMEYQHALDRGQPGRGKSFPCGHSGAGFALCVFYFIWRRNRPRRAWGALALAVVYGGAHGVGRVIAGAHFASDVLWSAWVVGAVAWILYYFVLNVPGREAAGPEACAAVLPKRGGSLIAIAVGVAVLVGAMYSKPVFFDINYRIRLPAGGGADTPIDLKIESGDVTLRFGAGNHVRVTGEAEGFGMVGCKVKGRVEHADLPGSTGRFVLEEKGHFSELNTSLAVDIPTNKVRQLRLELNRGTLRAPPRPGAFDLSAKIGTGAARLDSSWEQTPGAVRHE